MSELDKMMAFGQWLTLRKSTVNSELFQLSVNANHTVDKIRVKAGHLEALQHVLEAFTELYNGDLNKFKEAHLGVKPESEEESQEDVSHT